jgi:3-keto-5-aminohexanoate cleavage enzyme
LGKLIIEARVNEYTGRQLNPNVPFSPEEIAQDGLQCWREGAAIIHFHARDPKTGAPSSKLEHYSESIRRMKDHSDVLTHPTLGAWWVPSPEQRISHIVEMAKEAATKPDFAPIDMVSSIADVYDLERRAFLTDETVYFNTTKTLRFLAETMRKVKVRPLVALWNVGSVRLTAAFVEAGILEEPVYAEASLFEGGLLSGHPGTVRGLEALVDFIPPSLHCHWSVLCYGGNLFPIIGSAIERGGHISIGLGDYHYNELDTPRNADVIKRVVQMARDMGREVASPGEARNILGLR